METDMEGHSLSYKYDIMDNVTEVRDGLGNTVSYEYDIYGRMVKEKDANGNETCYEYDCNGNCITKTNALNISSHMEYDACNRLTKAYVEKDGEEYAVQYRYDAMGRVTETKDEEGNTTKIHYDILGNVESTEDAQGNVTQTRTYDSMNRPETVTDMITGNVTKYHYDVMGNCYSALYIGVLSADYFPDFLCCTTFLSNYFQLFRQINNGHVYDVPT